jgi:hypothetical protein
MHCIMAAAAMPALRRMRSCSAGLFRQRSEWRRGRKLWRRSCRAASCMDAGRGALRLGVAVSLAAGSSGWLGMIGKLYWVEGRGGG